MLARALHANSPRKDKPFVAVNVAALPAELLESELFGHVKGAFIGAATAKHGLFEAARILGIGRTTLWRKLRAFGIDTEE